MLHHAKAVKRHRLNSSLDFAVPLEYNKSTERSCCKQVLPAAESETVAANIEHEELGLSPTLEPSDYSRRLTSFCYKACPTLGNKSMR